MALWKVRLGSTTALEWAPGLSRRWNSHCSTWEVNPCDLCGQHSLLQPQIPLILVWCVQRYLSFFSNTFGTQSFFPETSKGNFMHILIYVKLFTLVGQACQESFLPGGEEYPWCFKMHMTQDGCNPWLALRLDTKHPESLKTWFPARKRWCIQPLGIMLFPSNANVSQPDMLALTSILFIYLFYIGGVSCIWDESCLI